MSLGQGRNQSGLNMAVSGAKIAWEQMIHTLHFFCVFPSLKCCWQLQIFIPNTEKSRIRSRLWLRPWNQTVWVHFTWQYSHPSIDLLFFFTCHKASHLPCTDPFRRWISRRTGSWWPFSSEAMTCVSTATTEWVSARSRHGEFPASRQIKGSVHKRQPPQQWTVARVMGRNNTTTTRRVVWRLVCRAVSWYHLSRIIKLCDRPSP